MARKPTRPVVTGGFDSGALNNIVQLVALIGAGIWAVYTFIYQSEIAPSLAPPTVTLSSTLENTGHRGDMTAIRCTLTRSNGGQSAVRVEALTYNAIGIKEHFLPSDDTNPRFDLSRPDGDTVNLARYYAEPERQEVILKIAKLFAGAVSEGVVSELNPGESVTRDILFYADRSKFDRIRLKVRLVYAKTSDPGVPLALETDSEGMMNAVETPGCLKSGAQCGSVFSVDYVTELSLWD